MSDQTTSTAPVDETTDAPAAEETPSVADTIVLPKVAAAPNAQIGDENLAPVHEVEVDVNKGAVPAQVAAPETTAIDEVYVHETSVELDRVITDPSSPEAVQIPDAGRGTLDLPIHGLDAPRVEDVFAKANAEAEKNDN